MDIFEAIFQRHSVDALRPDPIPRALTEQLLAAAAQAPNHFRVRPWRFIVLEGDARRTLADALAAAFARRNPAAAAEALEKEAQKAYRAPLVIVIAADLPSEPRVLEFENVLAAGAAVQNLLLAAHALGLGAKWRTTGSGSYEPEVHAALGLLPEQPIVAVVYVGYPQQPTPAPERPSFEEKTTWM